SYTGPLKFLCEGVGAQFGLSKSDADVMYTAVDNALSINGIMSYKLTEDAARLYRYVNADLLWGLKSMGIKNMTTAEILLEIVGDINT
ncbi:DUF4225 domain-containing protein, partial [Salmonella enterica]|uniref:DUF4225 domain-containing protein n=1 Tax=Salmonella enterica TaxID=28901 RepID=UPI001E553DBD